MNKSGHYDKQLFEYFARNPRAISYSYTNNANIIGCEYRTVRNFIRRYLTFDDQQLMREGQLPQVIFDNYPEASILIAEQTSRSTTTTQNYPKSNRSKAKQPINASHDDNEILSLQEYCDKYHIPYDQVTSSKFVNHQGQAAWNVVCDHTKISQAHLDDYFDRLSEILTKAIEPQYFEIPKTANNKLAYHFYHADKHVGAKTRDNALYDNVYNAEIFKERLMHSLSDFIEVSQYFGRFDKVLVADLGDSVDGWNGKTTRNSSHTLPQNLDNRETFDVYVDAMCEFFDRLIALKLADHYEFIACTNDNHSGGFGYIVNRAVEIYLKARYPQIKTRIGSQFIEHYEYGNHMFMLTHGKDEEDMKSGWPLNLDQKTESFIDNHIDYYNFHDKWCHVVKGDLHQESMNRAKKFRYRGVVSLYGSSAWMMTNFGHQKAGVSSEIVWKEKNRIMPTELYFEKSN